MGFCCEIHGSETPDIWPEMANATLVSLAQNWQVHAEVHRVGSRFAILKLLLMIVLAHCIVWQTVTSWRRQLLCEDK